MNVTLLDAVQTTLDDVTEILSAERSVNHTAYTPGLALEHLKDARPHADAPADVLHDYRNAFNQIESSIRSLTDAKKSLEYLETRLEVGT